MLFWNYFHLVLTKDMGKIQQPMQGCIMIKTKEISPSLILKYQYKSLFHDGSLMRFSPWIHLQHFSLMNETLLLWSLFCIWSETQVLWLQGLCTVHCIQLSKSRSLVASGAQAFSSICPVYSWSSSGNTACVSENHCVPGNLYTWLHRNKRETKYRRGIKPSASGGKALLSA